MDADAMEFRGRAEYESRSLHPNQPVDWLAIGEGRAQTRMQPSIVTFGAAISACASSGPRRCTIEGVDIR